jgi:hypothetical protein
VPAAAPVALGEDVPVVAAADRVAGTLRAVLPAPVQVVERVVAGLGAVAQGGDAPHVEERAAIVGREGRVEVSHGLNGNRASGAIANFWPWGYVSISQDGKEFAAPGYA